MSDIEVGSEWKKKGSKNTLVKVVNIETWDSGERFIETEGVTEESYGGERERVFVRYYELLDMVNHPPHYKDESGIECIEVTKHMQFCGGNCFKYLYRAGKKGSTVEDLKKAAWYAERAWIGNEMVCDEARDKIFDIAHFRLGNIAAAMDAVRFNEWDTVEKYVRAEIARLENK